MLRHPLRTYSATPCTFVVQSFMLRSLMQHLSVEVHQVSLSTKSNDSALTTALNHETLARMTGCQSLMKCTIIIILLYYYGGMVTLMERHIILGVVAKMTDASLHTLLFQKIKI